MLSIYQRDAIGALLTRFFLFKQELRKLSNSNIQTLTVNDQYIFTINLQDFIEYDRNNFMPDSDTFTKAKLADIVNPNTQTLQDVQDNIKDQIFTIVKTSLIKSGTIQNIDVSYIYPASVLHDGTPEWIVTFNISLYLSPFRVVINNAVNKRLEGKDKHGNPIYNNSDAFRQDMIPQL